MLQAEKRGVGVEGNGWFSKNSTWFGGGKGLFSCHPIRSSFGNAAARYFEL